jgi:hypothetical protein
MNNKVILAALAGGIAFFLIGWLIYGILLTDFMAANSNACAARKMEEMVWWALIASNLIWALFLAMVFDWTGTTTLMGGLQKGATLGFLTALGFDLGIFAMSTMYLNLTAVLTDVIASTAMSAVAGGLIAYVLGMGGKKETA